MAKHNQYKQVSEKLLYNETDNISSFCYSVIWKSMALYSIKWLFWQAKSNGNIPDSSQLEDLDEMVV